MNPLTPSHPAPDSSWHLPALSRPHQIPLTRAAMFAVPLLLVVLAGIFIYARRRAIGDSHSEPRVLKFRDLADMLAYLKEEVPPIEDSFPFAEVKARHEQAKRNFGAALVRFDIDSTVCYVKAKNISDPAVTQSELNPAIFSWFQTKGVQQDIVAASKQSGEIHLFCVASQYNCAEATSPFTPAPGKAMLVSETDNTQGPACQRTNPRLFELVNAYLANGGFNMLAEVLDENTIKALKHGYLVCVDDPTEALVADQFERNWEQVEQVCISSHPENGGAFPIYLMMAAAPCYDTRFSKSFIAKHRLSIQRSAALANFTAQFNQVVHLAEQNPGKKIIYHAAAVGLGAFVNNPQEVGDAFKAVALRYQEKFAELKNVQIQFDVFAGYGAPDEKALQCVQQIGLQEKGALPF